jgi:hypothetical protein
MSGVAAGRAGRFSLVIGVGRGAGREALRMLVAALAWLDAARAAGRG